VKEFLLQVAPLPVAAGGKIRDARPERQNGAIDAASED
jgi:hypothetical protein